MRHHGDHRPALGPWGPPGGLLHSLPTPEPLHIRGQLGIIFKNRAVICAALLLGVVELVNAASATSLYYLDAVVGNVTLKSVFSLATLAISLDSCP